MKLRIFGLVAAGLLTAASASQAVGVSGQGTWETTLQPRDINGDSVVDAFYDTVLKVTWLADANAGAGSAYDSASSTTASDGLMTWNDARAWAANLNVYGAAGWRLPTMLDSGASGCNFAYGETDCGYSVQTISADGAKVYSELAHLYYTSLGNKPGCDATGDCTLGNNASAPTYLLSNTGGFSNLRPFGYWTGVAYAPFPADFAWLFITGDGNQGLGDQHAEFYALAVRTGDVTAAVPEPQSYALVLLGLGALALVRRRRST